jgi:nucleotide-binding universal stress UspA family protein
VKRASREFADRVRIGPTCILVGIPAQAKFAETAALRYATELATGCKAPISLIVFPPAIHQHSTGGATVADEQGHKPASATVDGASRFISHVGVDLVAQHSPSDGHTLFAQLARVHDVTVLDTAESGSPGRAAIRDALFDSGRLVLVIPPQGGRPVPRRIAIAWDGSARAARAVSDALMFLRTAELVVAVTVSGEKDLSHMAPGAGLAAYLARHDVGDCKLATLSAKQADVAARLRLFVAEEDIEMIVMGAFVHSRLREAMLGGVTRSMLDDAPLPLFLAH